ncbi:unnamed protein product [Caenorhabditis auriculariae]|uniref:SAM domain-containing protein n=1 Tax=Caenorhabditis auriculariae TaxID=2777116 RepID=A0A8S1GUI3_9PELO|nr:unnamed protein product [Caenorhabditis auriculariae]
MLIKVIMGEERWKWASEGGAPNRRLPFGFGCSGNGWLATYPATLNNSSLLSKIFNSGAMIEAKLILLMLTLFVATEASRPVARHDVAFVHTFDTREMCMARCRTGCTQQHSEDLMMPRWHCPVQEEEESDVEEDEETSFGGKVLIIVPCEMSRIDKKDPTSWDYKEVAEWLTEIGLEEYAAYLTQKHKINGRMLLTITDSDLREQPVAIRCLGDIKKLLAAISALRNSNDSVDTEDKLLCVEYDKQRKMSISGEEVYVTTRQSEVMSDKELIDTLNEGEVKVVQLISREELIRHVESPDTSLKSLIKLIIAFFYCSLSFLITAIVMVFVHDRVPDTKTYPPLPDIVLDNVPHIPWAFDMCEIIGLTLVIIWLFVLAFHRNRMIITRRLFSLLGTAFLLRCVTMLITSLSVPGIHLQCTARVNTTMSEKMSEAFMIWSRLGMSLRGVRSCGDYMFSGHTTAITIINHFITEYTPETWAGLHTTTWVMNCFAIFLILAAHEHYSIDVFIAFYISSRMFLYYHAYAYNHAKITATDGRMRIWFPLGWFFEYGSLGKVPNEFEMPINIRIPKSLQIFSFEEVFGTKLPTAANTEVKKIMDQPKPINKKNKKVKVK